MLLLFVVRVVENDICGDLEEFVRPLLERPKMNGIKTRDTMRKLIIFVMHVAEYNGQ